MTHVIVDTDVFSYLLQGQGQRFEPLIKGKIPVLTFTSVAELHFGAAKSHWGERRVAALEDAMRRYLVTLWGEDLAKLWGLLKAQAVKTGHPLGHAPQSNDLWICASAIRYDAPLLTNNQRHFANFPGLNLLYPSDD